MMNMRKWRFWVETTLIWLATVLWGVAIMLDGSCPG